MSKLFKEDRNYILGDPDLTVIGCRAKLARWRHEGKGPVYYCLGRKIIYRGSDLNAWADKIRVDPSDGGEK